MRASRAFIRHSDGERQNLTLPRWPNFAKINVPSLEIDAETVVETGVTDAESTILVASYRKSTEASAQSDSLDQGVGNAGFCWQLMAEPAGELAVGLEGERTWSRGQGERPQ